MTEADIEHGLMLCADWETHPPGYPCKEEWNCDVCLTMTGQVMTMLPKALVELRQLRAVAEAAHSMLQDHLKIFGHGCIEDWSPEMEKGLGWTDSPPVVLRRALKAWRDHA